MATYGDRTNGFQEPLKGSQTSRQYKAGVTSSIANFLTTQAKAKAKTAAPAAGYPDVNNLPVDATYDSDVGTLESNRTVGHAQIANQNTQALTSYGYNAAYDPSGKLTGLTYDSSNPYSQASLAKKSYDAHKRGALNSAGNQVFSGSQRNAQNSADSSYAQSDNALRSRLGTFLASQQIANTAVDNTADTGKATAKGDSFNRAIAQWLATH